MKYLFTIVFLFFLGVVYAQVRIPEAPINAVVFGNTFGQYEKIEVGIDPPTILRERITNFLLKNDVPQEEKVNPFLEWELDVRAEFKHIQTGTKITRSGFYFRAMARDESRNSWKDTDNEYPLRVRFASGEIGEWEVSVEVFVHNTLIYKLNTLSFEVVESANLGYVGITDNKLNFEHGGEIIIPSGVNLPHPYVGNNMLYSLNPKEKLKMEAWKVFNQDVERYANEGGKYFRFFMGPSASDIEFEELGNYYDRLNFAWEIDNMLAICESKKMFIDFNMMLHTPLMISADYHQFRWDYSNFWPDAKAWPYKDPNPVYCYAKEFNSERSSDMFLNPEPMKYIKQRYRYMLARWGYSTAIMMWEPLSEPWHVNEGGVNHFTPYDAESGDIERKAAHTFHKEIAQYIKHEFGDKNHLIGAVGRFPVGSKRIFSHPDLNEGSYNDSTWFDENIDVISISYYTSSPEKKVISKPGKSALDCESGENSMYCVIDRLNKVYNKPVIFGESDHGDGTHACSSMKGNKIDVMSYPISGAAGHFLWATFIYSLENKKQSLDEREIWKEVVLAESFFNSEYGKEVFATRGFQGRERAKVSGNSKFMKHHEYIINKDQSKGIGYLYNRSYNVHTMGDSKGELIEENSPCFIQEKEYQLATEITWKPNKMTLEGLAKRQRYVLRYYGFESADFVNEFEIRANLFGKAKLVHPVLGTKSSDHPFYWYQIIAQ